MNRYFETFLIPLIVPVLIGMGSAGVTGMIMTARLDERLATVEKVQERHEGMLSQLRDSGANHATRLASNESEMKSVSSDLQEIKSDVKILLRGRQ